MILSNRSIFHKEQEKEEEKAFALANRHKEKNLVTNLNKICCSLEGEMRGIDKVDDPLKMVSSKKEKK